MDSAGRTAAAAYPGWRDTSLVRRAAVMFAFRDLVRKHSDEIAALITAEHGKVASDAAGELARGLEVVEFACGIPHLLKGSFSENVSTSVDAYSIRQPLGVVAGITPFNFPAMVPMWMFPVALAAGNAFVLKPSEKDPSTALRLAELLSEAGLPDGVFNVVNGGKEAVDALLNHPEVKAVSFVGSTPIARYVSQTAMTAGKRVQALGGAKNFHVVMPDADLDRTVEALVGSAYGSAGERCLAGSVVIAVGGESDQDRFIRAMASRAERLLVKEGTNPDADMGPLIRAAHRNRVAGYIEKGVAEGAALVYDGRKHPVPQSGFFLGPSLFDRVDGTMAIAQEEIFGPVLSVIRQPDLEAAVKTANASRFGNTATIYTQSGASSRYFRNHIEAGMVGVNVGVAQPFAFYPFSGWRGSFYGDLHIQGTDGVDFYTRKKMVVSRW